MSQRSASGRRMSCELEQKRTCHLVKENPASNSRCEKAQQNCAQHHKTLSLTTALDLHAMLSEGEKLVLTEGSTRGKSICFTGQMYSTMCS